MNKRRATTIDERLTPCEACGHYLTQRHHLLEFADWGENEETTVQLCANCHELYHLVHGAYVKKGKHSKLLLGKLLWKIGFGNEIIGKIRGLVDYAEEFKIEVSRIACETALKELAGENDTD